MMQKRDVAAIADGETRALMAAREWVAKGMEPSEFFTVAPLHRAGGHALVRQMLKRFALSHPLNMALVCTYARAGLGDADLALRELIAEFAERRELMPLVLSAYNLELIAPGRVPPTVPRGKKKADHLLQDIIIIVFVIMVKEEFGFQPTRQRHYSAQPSACSIVAEALAKAGIHRGGERAIEKVWQRYSPIILDGFHWQTHSAN